MSDESTLQALLDGPRKFFKDSVSLINRCTKPDKKGTGGWCVRGR